MPYLTFEIRSWTRAFTLIELVVSVALLIVAISIALFAVVGSNGMIQKADARGVVSESNRSVGDAIRRVVGNAAIGTVGLRELNADGKTSPAVQIKSFSSQESLNTCSVIGRATVKTVGGEEQYTINKDGPVIALLIYNLDSGGLCPTATAPLYQNRLTNDRVVAKETRFDLQDIACQPSSNCVTKQLLRYTLTLELMRKGSGGTSEARQSTLTVQTGLAIGLVNEATSALKIDTTTLSDGMVGVEYLAGLIASGGMPTYGWSVSGGSLPSGLSLDELTGVISGTPTIAGPKSFAVELTDSANPPSSTTKDFSLTIQPTVVEGDD